MILSILVLVSFRPCPRYKKQPEELLLQNDDPTYVVYNVRARGTNAPFISLYDLGVSRVRIFHTEYAHITYALGGEEFLTSQSKNTRSLTFLRYPKVHVLSLQSPCVIQIK